MYLLDTNIVSLLDPRRRARVPQLIEWLERNGAALFVSVITLTEIEAGILKLRREGKSARADELAALRSGIVTDFADRVLPMDAAIAVQIARIAERARPNVIELADLIVAATAEQFGLVVLTHNVRHFKSTGVPYCDPLDKLPPDT